MTQPPYGQDPQNQPPPQPYGQTPYGQPGPYGPPPPARKSPAVLIGVIVLVILLVAGGGLAALLLLSDSDKDDDENNKADARTSESTSAPAGDLVQGNGYSYTLPDGWNDVTDQAAGAPGAIDTVSAWGDKLEGGRANFIVESGSSGGEDEPEALRDQWVSNMTGSTGGQPQEIPGATIDGENSIGVQFERTNEKDVEIVQTAYLVVRDGKVYSIAISAKIGDDDAEQAFEEILDSWTWE